jgi:predicted aspartyl protease
MNANVEERAMGRVTAEATMENLRDLWEADQGLRPPGAVRRIVVADALIDTGASSLSLPISMIRQLGLEPGSRRRVRTADGPREVQQYSAVKLRIQDRDATIDVVEVPDDCPVLIGQVPLELMDFVVDPKNQKLIGNPAHGGDWVLEMY